MDMDPGSEKNAPCRVCHCQCLRIGQKKQQSCPGGRLPGEQIKKKGCELVTLQGTNISPKNGILNFEDDFPFPKVGYVNSLEGTPFWDEKHPEIPSQQ